MSVQVPYHFGWRATSHGRSAKLFPDALGMMVIAPECDGRCTITLTFDSGTEAVVVRILSALTWIGAIAVVIVWRRRREQGPPPRRIWLSHYSTCAGTQKTDNKGSFHRLWA